jgi:MOSC domain-containing protein YiiM
MFTLKELLSRSAQPGRLDWIGVRPERRAAMVELQSATLIAQRGIEGDRAAQRVGRSRQVTLIQAEHLATLASFIGAPVKPAALRRNLMIARLNVLSLRRARFSIGEALFEGTGHCHPCSRLEETLGFGGYNASRGLAGITARVLEGGLIRLGDPVVLLESPADGGA